MPWDDLEAKYYEFLREKGYITAQTDDSILAVYVPFFEAGDRVLDIGCGDGQFLDLLKEKGCEPYGVDIDPEMVELAQERGHQVEQGDMHAFLSAAEADYYDGVFSSNVIEHISPPDVLKMLEGAYRVMKPGGRILLATPNAESLIVHLHEFWRDATHDRLYNRQLLEFMLWYTGFELVEADVNPYTAWEPPLNKEAPPNFSGLNGVSEVEASAAPEAGAGTHADVTDYAAQWNAWDAVGLPAYMPASERRARVANFLYRITKEVDLRLYKLEAIIAHQARRTEKNHTALAERTHQLQAEHDAVREQFNQLLAALGETQASLEGVLGHIRTRVEAIENTVNFLFPPREIYVVGRKVEKKDTSE